MMIGPPDAGNLPVGKNITYRDSITKKVSIWGCLRTKKITLACLKIVLSAATMKNILTPF
jgi:hypothetical protein